MPDIQFHSFDSRVDLDICLAREIAASLERAIAARGAASLALSGGKTPMGMFEQLRQMRLDWKKVWITLVDDRWLPVDHADSNEGLARQFLLRHQLAEANFVSLHTEDASPEAAIPALTARLAGIPQPFDVVHLGMGEDGHTASLFPCAAELACAADPGNPALLAAVHPTTAPYARISLTLAAIIQARHVLLHINGDKKKSVLDKALSAPTPLAPIARVLTSARVGAHVYYAD
ncbi:6-phosphogluconolactonase [Burkholderiaceae bacterium DAT-1]|nr:6-phosphogluconolactonase [Burkholderiaceae bacterium DAT-1]